MTFRFALPAAAAALCVLMPLSASADTQLGDFALSGNVGFTSDYIYRGISQSDEGPAV